MTPGEIEQRRAEAKAWNIKVANLANDYLRYLQQDGRPPVFVFFGTSVEQHRFWREMVAVLDPIRVPTPAREDVVRPTPRAVQGSRRRLIMVHQSYPWITSRNDGRDADDAAHLIDVLNAANGWT